MSTHTDTNYDKIQVIEIDTTSFSGLGSRMSGSKFLNLGNLLSGRYIDLSNKARFPMASFMMNKKPE